MALINKQDTDGIKAVLVKGELGYDDYQAGGDTGRVYVGTGSQNIPLGKLSEIELVEQNLATHKEATSGEDSHTVATTDQAGFMAANSVDKLAGIEAEANRYELPPEVVQETDYATETVGGSIKVGQSLEIAGGVLNTKTSRALANWPASRLGSHYLLKSASGSTTSTSFTKVAGLKPSRGGAVYAKAVLSNTENVNWVKGRITLNGVPITGTLGSGTHTIAVNYNLGDIIAVEAYIIGSGSSTASLDLLTNQEDLPDGASLA